MVPSCFPLPGYSSKVTRGRNRRNGQIVLPLGSQLLPVVQVHPNAFGVALILAWWDPVPNDVICIDGLPSLHGLIVNDLSGWRWDVDPLVTLGSSPGYQPTAATRSQSRGLVRSMLTNELHT